MTLSPQAPLADSDATAQWAILRLMPLADDDLFTFDEQEDSDIGQKSVRPWSIMIVDDDSEVHRAIELALMMVRIRDRPLLLTHCSSAADARRALERSTHPVDLMLLDVVMETVDAGLTLLDEMRMRPATQTLPVLLHTGQPGQAPEQMIRARYDISGYLTKTTVTRQGLIAALETILGGATLGER
jgi:CheY-like chemotaxis protein